MILGVKLNQNLNVSQLVDTVKGVVAEVKAAPAKLAAAAKAFLTPVEPAYAFIA